MHNTAANKAIVLRFNRECIEQGNEQVLRELLAADVINHSAPEGMPQGAESFRHFLFDVLRSGFSDLQVEILEQVAEHDLVTTRKKIKGIHTGPVFGIPASQKPVTISVIDIIRIKNGKYAEHWGQSNFSDVLKTLA